MASITVLTGPSDMPFARDPVFAKRTLKAMATAIALVTYGKKNKVWKKPLSFFIEVSNTDINNENITEIGTDMNAINKVFTTAYLKLTFLKTDMKFLKVKKDRPASLFSAIALSKTLCTGL